MSETTGQPEPRIPTVKLLQSIRPENAGTGEPMLVYDRLAPAIEEYQESARQRENAFWDEEPDSLDEQFKGRQLAFQYLLQTALRTIEAPTPEQHDTWAARYTQGSVELYGAPDQEDAKTVLAEEYSWLQQNKDNPVVSREHMDYLLETYEGVIENTPDFTHGTIEKSETEAAAVAAYGVAIRDKYQPVFDLVDQEKPDYTPADLHDLFTRAVDYMSEHEGDSWKAWRVAVIKGTGMSVNSRERVIEIGERRPAASPKEAVKLLAHELLVHALRNHNGFETGNDKLGTGLAGYVEAEEGLGKLNEYAVTGEPPESSRGYLNIALALGTLDGVERQRPELLKIATASRIVRAQVKQGTPDVNTADLIKSATGAVDRIYRGGRGDDFGRRPAVFTKDISYYAGYKRMARYVSEQLQAGRSAAELFAYLSQGSFDPTDPRHVEVVAATVRPTTTKESSQA